LVSTPAKFGGRGTERLAIAGESQARERERAKSRAHEGNGRAVAFRAPAFSFTARGAVCAKYTSRWDAISRVGKHLVRSASARSTFLCTGTLNWTARLVLTRLLEIL
jgi:hypothetical protein